MNGLSWVGKTIAGRYRIDDLLGQGGMSAVYSAYDPNLRRNVAIKLIHTHLSNDPNFIGRFKEEAAAVARLRHPNIVQVHDFNIDNGTYYMVMEYLAGETLQARLKRLKNAGRHMPFSEAVHICTQLCDAVGYAHNHELVHRDIKPANIMLDVNDQAILMDFGIVKIIGGDYHTATGATIGTAMYMPPEQIRSERIDDRSDIYSLGVTLYEMISGRPPYLADSAMTIMMMVLNDPLPDMSELREGVPEKLLAVVQKALSKEPSERFQTMGDMATALKLPPEQLLSTPLAATVVDNDEFESAEVLVPEIPVTQPAPELETGGTSPPQFVSEVVEFQQQEEFIPAAVPLAVRDTQTEPETTQTQSDIPAARSKFILGSSSKLIVIVGLLILISAIAAGVLFINQKPPNILLTPISQPEIPIDIQTAQSVVNLGDWETDSHIEALTYSPDGSQLGTANNRDVLPISPYRFFTGLWHVDSGFLRGYLFGHNQWVYDVAFTPDGQHFGTASDDATVNIWQIKYGELVRTIDASFGGFTSLDFSSNNKLLAAGSWDGTVGLWQLDNGNLLRTLHGNDYSIRDVAFSPDGQLLAAASDDDTILLWQVSDGGLVHTLQGHTDIIYRLAFSPDGTLLASASEDYTIGLWQVSEGNLLRTLQGHADSVYDVAFSQDGSLLASGSGDGTLRLWRVSDGQMVNSLIEHWDHITSVAFSPDGRLLVSGAADGILHFWGISDAIPLDTKPLSDSP